MAAPTMVAPTMAAPAMAAPAMALPTMALLPTYYYCRAREHSDCGTVVDGPLVDYCPKHRREASHA